MELGLLILCNAGIIAFLILGIMGALSPNGQQQGKRKRGESIIVNKHPYIH